MRGRLRLRDSPGELRGLGKRVIDDGAVRRLRSDTAKACRMQGIDQGQ